MSTDTTRLEWEPTGADATGASDEFSPGADVTDRRAHVTDRPVPRAAHRATVAVLTARAAALEAELEHEAHHHQQVVQQYERLLAEAQERDSRKHATSTREREDSNRLRGLFDRLF